MKGWILFLIALIPSLLMAAEKTPWQQDWERTLGAARKEGKVSVTGPGGVEARETPALALAHRSVRSLAGKFTVNSNP
jgi:hypothetical protein